MSPYAVRRAALGVALLVALAASMPAQVPAPPADPGPSRPNYVVGSADVLTVTVYGDQDLSRDYRVENDGYVRLPLLKERIKAAGRTIEELQAAIADAYTKAGLLRNPQILVWVKENKSAFITLSGNFQSPRVVEYVPRMTLMQAIALGNGLNTNAGATIVILRKPPGAAGEPQRLVVPIRELTEGRDPALNIALQPGDEISVLRQDFIFIGGAVNRTGPIPMGDDRDWTVLKALIAAGNATRFAKLDQAVLRRKLPDGRTQEIAVNAKKILQRKGEDVAMIANDILLVPESGGRKALVRAAESALSIGSGVAIISAGR